MKLRFKAYISSLLVLVMTLGLIPAYAASDTGLCEHHTEHDASCGYVEAVEGKACIHEHGEECYETVTNGIHVHGDCGYTPAVPETECQHVHDANCGYSEGSAEVLCQCVPGEDGSIVHAEGCGYTPAVPGTECSHRHDESCGWSEGRPEQGVCKHLYQTCHHL